MIPVKNQILVKPFPADSISTGGILLPQSAQRVSNKVHIVKVGTGTKEKPMKLKPGSIGYRVYEWGCPVEIDGEIHFIMDAEAILAIE